MQWKDYRQSENIEDRRPVSSKIKDPYLGEIEVLREKFSGEIVGAVPTDFNQKCVPVMREQLKVFMLEESIAYANKMLGDITQNPEHQAAIDAARKTMPDHRKQSVFKMLFDGKSCESQLARFYNTVSKAGLDVTFDAVTTPAKEDPEYTPGQSSSNSRQDVVFQEERLRQLIPSMKAIRRLNF